jgi:penicillin-binding protein 1C
MLDPNGGRHTAVDLSAIPLALRQATIDTEDSSFYSNPGVDLVGVARAVWINLTGGQTLSGGSTITQQVARNLLMTAEERADRSPRRKLREMILAWELTRSFSKDEILALYLNQMYYGNLAYGVEAASQTYFGLPAAQLDLAQSALLAGLAQLPGIYDPYQHPEAAKKRQEVVLGLMQKAGTITAEQRALAAAEPLIYNQHSYPILAPHFVMMVRGEVDALIARAGANPLSTENIYRMGGLTVRTTLDLDQQQLAEEAVQRQLARLKTSGEKGVDPNVNDAALVAIDPHTGQILALVGSPDYFAARISGSINMATAPRQPGSALKPLIYAAAMDPSKPDPWTAATMLLDVSTSFATHDGKAYVPVDYDGKERGPVLARPALASSLNIPAVLVLQKVGLQRFLGEASQLGITTFSDPDQYDLSLALGGGDVSLLQLTAAYGALAAGGQKVTPQDILDVRDPQGNVLYTLPAAERPQVIDPRVAWLVSDMLSDDAAREIGFGRNSVLQIDRPAAVKTGTTTNFHDNWTVGYTPSLVVGVWAGNADQAAMHGVNGLTGAAPIWHEFIRSALTGQKVESFERPAGLVQVEVCALSGKLPGPDCPYRRLEWFVDGTQPRTEDTMCHKVAIDSRTGLPASDATPPENRETRLALDLPAQAFPWARANQVLLYSNVASQSLAMHSSQSASGLQILSPPDLSVYHLSASQPADAQRVLIQVAGVPRAAQVTLWVDGQQVAQFSKAPYEFWWPLKLGKHTIRAEGGDGSTASVTIEVK